MRWKYKLSCVNPGCHAQQGLKPEGARARGVSERRLWPFYPPYLALSCRCGGPVAGGRPCRRLAACPHSPEQVCGGGRFTRLCFPPRWAGLIHLDAVARRRAQQATGLCHPPAGGCRLVTKAVGPTKSLLNEPLRPGSVGNRLFLCTANTWKPAVCCLGNFTKWSVSFVNAPVQPCVLLKTG